MTMRRLLMLLLIIFCAFPTLAQEDSQSLTHVVQPGETLYRISQRYGVTMDVIAQANNITDYTRIYSGQVLTIPGLSVPDSSTEVVNPLVAGTPHVHVVQPGETLTLIAQQYNMTVDQLMQSNNITNPNHITRGQSLNVWLPEGDTTQIGDAFQGTPPDQNINYVVQPGESLSDIARRYGMDWQTLAQMNGIIDANRVYAGQTLVVPALNSAGGIVDMGIVTNVNPVGAPVPTITVGKQIVVDLSDSRIYAYQDGVLVHSVVVSTGLPATPTVQGDFTIQRRVRSQTMSGPGYYLPNVEWVLYFYQGYAIHGTYWHNNFGRPMSHGCVNLPNDEAQWFYDNFGEIGTPVHVQA